MGCLPTTAYRDLRWWRKRISNAKRSVWQTRWNSVKTSLKDWKPEVGPWKSQLSSKVQAEKLLARIRLNRHHSQDIPGKKRTPCRCGARILTFKHAISHCPLWTTQRQTLIHNARRALEDPHITAEHLQRRLLEQQKKPLQEWKINEHLYNFITNTIGA